MARYGVAPTKSNLIRTKTNLSFAREGHELLSRKRDILIAELLGAMAAATTAQRRFEEALRTAFDALADAMLEMGVRGVREASWAVGPGVETKITERKVMGVNLPTVQSSTAGPFPFYALRPTSFRLDEAQRRFSDALPLLDEVVGTRMSVLRLAREVQKTVRRVNALEKIYIPDYAETLQYIGDALDESEREAFFILKLIKERLEKKSSRVKG